MRHNFVAYKAKHTVPNMGKEKKRSYGERRALQVVHLPLCPVSVL